MLQSLIDNIVINQMTIKANQLYTPHHHQKGT